MLLSNRRQKANESVKILERRMFEPRPFRAVFFVWNSPP